MEKNAGKQNITLSLPKDLLRKAKIIAIENDLSLSGLLAKTLSEIVRRKEEYQKAMKLHERLLKDGFDMGLHGSIDWRRDELHER